MQYLITRFLQNSHIDPVYFVTCIIDIVSYFLWGRLRKGLTTTERSLYKAIIFVAFVLTVASLSKVLGFFQEWKELKDIWKSWLVSAGLN